MGLQLLTDLRIGGKGLGLLSGIDPLDGHPFTRQPRQIGRQGHKRGIDLRPADPGGAAEGAIEHLQGSHGKLLSRGWKAD